jgi:hypothetical protein
MGCCTSDSTTQKENQQTKILEIEKKINEEEYLKLIQENIKRVQIIMSSYNKTDDIDVEDDKEEIDNTNQSNKKYFRFYIIYQLTLGKIRSLIEDYINYKNNNNIEKNNNIDFKELKFDNSLAKNYLDSLLNAEKNHNRKEVQQLEKEMIKNIFIENN